MHSVGLTERPVVLVIEDEPLILMNALDIVTGAGFEALEAASADEAILILASRDDIRVVFTDIRMRGCMDGLKLTHAVRHRWPLIEFIVTSGYSTVDASQLPSGARFFKKPYQPTQIVQVLRELLLDPFKSKSLAATDGVTQSFQGAAMHVVIGKYPSLGSGMSCSVGR
jgi:DNA-binding NtrC family response regulator